MLQNRVDPQGNIIKTPARGAWMGNRGLLHNEHKNVLRPFKLKAWIICVLQFKGRHRQVMAPNNYTELFFLDEATAFSAGHRPCYECRRQDAVRFKILWLKGNPQYSFNEKTPIAEIDNILHKERIDKKGNKLTHEELLKNLPDGTFILYRDVPYLLANSKLYHWSPGGYDKCIDKPDVDMVTVLTPLSIINTFREGYMPQMAINMD